MYCFCFIFFLFHPILVMFHMHTVITKCLPWEEGRSLPENWIVCSLGASGKAVYRSAIGNLTDLLLLALSFWSFVLLSVPKGQVLPHQSRTLCLVLQGLWTETNRCTFFCLWLSLSKIKMYNLCLFILYSWIHMHICAYTLIFKDNLS